MTYWPFGTPHRTDRLMVNKSGNIGTWGETHAVNFLRFKGFHDADRRALKGALDQGDILVCKGLIVEVKAGHAAEDASDEQLRKWCVETAREKVNAKAETAFLVVKRKGHGAAKVGSWWVVQNDGGMLTRFLFSEYVDFLFTLGYTANGFVKPDLKAVG